MINCILYDILPTAVGRLKPSKVAPRTQVLYAVQKVHSDFNSAYTAYLRGTTVDFPATNFTLAGCTFVFTCTASHVIAVVEGDPCSVQAPQGASGNFREVEPPRTSARC
eukprot:SAG11_NODE_20413_length_445_cov_12.800578_2_plen_108_part_01